MTLNREVFLEDPTLKEIPNLGVTKVVNPSTEEEWSVLRYELSHFVCEGEYERGLERILSSYLRNYDQAQQPAVWVSGFYGSGKSHLVRVLEYLWRDFRFPDGSTAQGLVNLPSTVRDPLRELGTLGKRVGGCWAAAGTLSAGAGDNVRLAFLGVILRGAGLPEKIEPARFVLWLHREGHFEQVQTAVNRAGRDFWSELRSLYVSPIVAEALLEASPGFAGSVGTVKELLKAQYPPVKDVSVQELLDIMADVFALVSTKPNRIPSTLVVLDELQQFISDDPRRMLDVQEVVEACSSKFESKVLFVATGQSALQATPVLQKLQGRFKVAVSLSDADVESVVRSVVLRKAPDRISELKSALDSVSGEIDRQLAGSKISPRSSDVDDLVPDYPILPARRRFWERTLRAVDRGGGAGQLRTQLRMVHEAVRLVADKPIGDVVPADFLYDQQATGMLETGVLLRETYSRIEELRDGTVAGELKARLCCLVFLISQLPTDPGSDIGIRATADTLADLLVEDLNTGGDALRKQVQRTLGELVQDGLLNDVGGEYRLLTRESAAWLGDYQARLSKIKGDTGRIASDRDQVLRSAVSEALRSISLLHGKSRYPRKIQLHFGQSSPPEDQPTVPVWIRDGWECTEKTLRDAALRAGTRSPTVFLWLPRQDSEELTLALAERAAAGDTFNARPIPATDEGREARSGMETRLRNADNRVNTLIARVLRDARVFQGGGSEVSEVTLEATVRAAAENALARLFPQFTDADDPEWAKVVHRAREGSGDPLSSVGYKGEVIQHPVCKEILAFVSNAGTKGADVRKNFAGSPYGWPQDAIDGGLLALVAVAALSVQQNGLPVTIKDVSIGKVSTTTFFKEVVVPTALQRIEVRKLLADASVPVDPSQEAPALHRFLDELVALGGEAGGEPPFPEPPPMDELKRLRKLVGNQLIVEAYAKKERLRADRREWLERRERIRERLPRWELLSRLARHAEGLPGMAEVQDQMDAIRAARELLADPDPTTPLLAEVGEALRGALGSADKEMASTYQQGMRALDAWQEWQQLSDSTRASILGQTSLSPPEPLDIGTDEALLATLDRTPLSDWSDKAAAIPHRVHEARLMASRALEPKATRFTPPQATLRSPTDVDTYIEELRSTLRRLVDDGPVII